jgi:hypothetical protein
MRTPSWTIRAGGRADVDVQPDGRQHGVGDGVEAAAVRRDDGYGNGFVHVGAGRGGAVVYRDVYFGDGDVYQEDGADAGRVWECGDDAGVQA